MAIYNPKGKVKSITIYDDSIHNYTDKLSDLARFYNDTEISENIRSRPKLYKKANEHIIGLIDYFKTNEDKIKITLFHELVHYSDDLVFSLDELSNKAGIILQNKLNKELKKAKGENYNSIYNKIAYDLYINSPMEYNAYYLEGIYSFLKKLDLSTEMTSHKIKDFGLDDFKIFKDIFIQYHMPHFKQFNNDYQKRILKRLYDFFININKLIQEN
jgi:hypothetical protein